MRKILILFLLISFYSFSQTKDQKILKGVVYNDQSYSIEGVHVLNITSEDATITASDGSFSISANVNDEIIFSAIQFKRNKILVDQNIFDYWLVLFGDYRRNIHGRIDFVISARLCQHTRAPARGD